MSEHARDPGRALPPVRRERGDVSFRTMAGLFALIGGGLGLMLLVAYLIYPGEVRDQRFATPFPSFPAPRLQPDPALDMKAFYAEEMRQLNGAGWQDKAAGTVHIPIAQAMGLVAKEGIPGWPTAAPSSEKERR